MRPSVQGVVFSIAVSTILYSAESALSAPITLGAPFLVVEDGGVNDLGRFVGKTIDFGDNIVIPNGDFGTTATAQTTNLLTGTTVSTTLPFVGSTALPNQFGRSILYNPNLTGPWVLSFKNGADTASVITPSAVGATPPPFAKNVTVSGSSGNPTFSWDYPIGSIGGVIINIYDKSRMNASGAPDAVYAKSLPGTSNTFTVPNALAGGLTLELNHDYVIGIVGAVLRDPSLPASNSNSLSWSRAYFDFTPVPAGSPVVNLPVIVPGGAYQYSMTVVGGTTYFLDPKIAVGYKFQTGAGNPNFAAVVLPAIQSDPFDISFIWNGMSFDELLFPESLFTFPMGGVSAFTVTGIAPSLGLDPGNTTAFITGITFVGDGEFTGTQTPITAELSVPEPSSFMVLAGGLWGLMLARRRCLSRVFSKRRAVKAQQA
ncbi:MAG: PEP-CTERM sorting domain-containing protein [Alphaproteobacteria bacterium]